MGIETLTRSAKKSYEEWFAQEQNGIHRLLFPTLDIDTTAAFAMDRFIQTPAGGDGRTLAIGCYLETV